MPPAQPGEVVAHGFGQIAHVGELAHGLGPVPLGQLGPVRTVDQGDVPHGRDLPAEGLVDQGLAGGIVHMVVAPDDVGDAHVVVVHHHGQIVGGGPVGAQQHQVIELDVAEADLPLHQVVQHRVAVERPLEADHVGRVGIVGRLVAPRTADGAALGPGLFAHRLQLRHGQVAAIGLSGGQQRHHCLPVPVGAGMLEHRLCIRGNAEPAQPLEDGGHGGLRRAFPVRVLHPQQELSTRMTCIELVEQRGPRAPNVQEAGGGGGEAGDDGTRGHGARLAGRYGKGRCLA